MATAVVEAKQIGGSIMVRIPKELVELEQIRPGEKVEVAVHKVSLDGFGMLQGIGPWKKEDKYDSHEDYS